MTRVLRDSTKAEDIPIKGTDLVAGYDNGIYAWHTVNWNRFTAHHVHIDVNGSHTSADVLDVERGDATISQAVQWVAHKSLHTPSRPLYPPIIYIARSSLTGLFNAMNHAGFNIVKDYRLWIATLDGTKKVDDMTGVTAVQWASAKITGHHYDESIVYDDHWKPATVVAPVPPPVVRTVFTADQKAAIRAAITLGVSDIEKRLGL